MSFFNIFTRPPSGDTWFPAGLNTSYPNITSSGNTPLSTHLPCQDLETTARTPGCKIFHVPSNDSTKAVEVSPETQYNSDGVPVPMDLKDQVLVFQYQGSFHAVDHVSLLLQSHPISSPLLSNQPNKTLELSSLLLPPLKRDALRYRRLRRPLKRRYSLPETRLVIRSGAWEWR